MATLTEFEDYKVEAGPIVEASVGKWYGVKFDGLRQEFGLQAAAEEKEEILLPTLLKAVLMHTKRWALTGSRAIIPWVDGEEDDRDWDFIVQLNASSAALFVTAATANCFYRSGEWYDKSVADLSGHDQGSVLWETQLPAGPEVDLIVFPDTPAGTEAYDRWLTATKVCKELGLKERKHRVMVFRVIRTGKWFPPKEKESNTHALFSGQGSTDGVSF